MRERHDCLLSSSEPKPLYGGSSCNYYCKGINFSMYTVIMVLLVTEDKANVIVFAFADFPLVPTAYTCTHFNIHTQTEYSGTSLIRTP